MSIPPDQQSPYPSGQRADDAPAVPDNQVDTSANARGQRDDDAPSAPAPEPIELWERETVLKFFGGDKPLHVSTLYRGVHSGIYPKPVNVAGNAVRWVGHECHAARQRMLSARAGPKQPSKRGRKRRRINP